MLAGPKPKIVTFLSTTTIEEKSGVLLNLSASLTRAGSDVLLLDACSSGRGVASRMDLPYCATVMDVVRQERALNEAVHETPEGFGIATLTRGVVRAASVDAAELRRLSNTFDVLAKQSGLVLVDGELNDDDTLAIPAMSQGDIVVQVSNSAESIKTAYALIKRLNAQLGRRPFGVLVTGASDSEASVVYENMAQAASRYLAVQLKSMGSVPADDHVNRAARLGRAVIDAFPMAGASIAFRRLAGRVAVDGALYS